MDAQDKADAKAAFRKPSSDAAHRKYRRHSSNSPSPPRYARESKEVRDYDRVTNENENKRSRDGDERHSRYGDRYDGANHKSRRHGERDFSSTSMDKDRYTREKDVRNETRSSRSTLGDGTRSSYDDDTRWTRNGSTKFVKGTRDEYKGSDSRETKVNRERERDTRGSREDRQDELECRSRRPHSPSKKTKFSSAVKCDDLKDSEQAQETSHKTSTQQSSYDADSSNNVDAAKVAAMRAAELVNKNLVGVGVAGALSTDQKKKLLWGGKKKAAEESGNLWDASLFPDREQQEKFNRLMGVKGEVKAEEKAGNQDGKGVLLAEKQKELQLNLEKQYTAGLRRKDGRTVGLGL